MVDRVLCRADWKLESTEDPRDIESVKGLRGILIIYISIDEQGVAERYKYTKTSPPRTKQKTRNVTLPSHIVLISFHFF